MIYLRNARRFFYKSLKQPGYAFKVFIRRLKGYLGYWLYKGKSSYPEAITLFLTHRCNLRCKMCGQWGEGGITKKQGSVYIKEELPLAELQSLVDDITIFRPNITLFGGEPFLYTHCLDLIRYIKRKELHCLIITNGSILEKIAEEIVDSGLDELNVSLDGQSALHDEIRGMPGLYNTIVSGLKQVGKYKEALKRKLPLINLQCTINRYNYQHLEQMLEVAKETKADSLTYHHLIFLDKSLIEKQQKINELLGCNSLDWEGFTFAPDIEAEKLYKKITVIKSRHYPFSVDVYPNFPRQELLDYYQRKDYWPSRGTERCVSPWIVAYIFPDGEVRPCLNFNYSYGNIKNNKFREIWNSPQAIKFRQELKKNKIFPVCARCTELYRY